MTDSGALDAVDRATFLREALDGLSAQPRTLPCKYFYDARGSRLFEAICEQPEYYLTRTELAIIRDNAAAMGEAIGPRAVLIEFGSGSAVKTRALLAHLRQPMAYVPVDISASALAGSTARHRAAFPDLPVLPVQGDFTADIELPEVAHCGERRVVFFPGSTLGNFEPAAAQQLLGRSARLVGPGGGMLLGVDLQKDAAVMEAAYNDAAGVTEQFDKNLLVRLRDELDAELDVDGFAHRSAWDADAGAIKTHLVSRGAQTIRLGGRTFSFADGDTIHTESSHKYRIDDLAAVARRVGLEHEGSWLDDGDLFGLLMFRASAA